MKNKYSYGLIFITAFIAIVAGAYAIINQGEIVAQVNDKPIYLSSIEEKIKQFKEAKLIDDSDQEFDFKSMDRSMKENLIRNFIISDLIENEAKINKINEDSTFKKALEFSNQQLLQKFFIEKKSKDNITDQKIKESYNQYVKEQAQKEEFKINQILVDKQEEANNIKQELNENPNLSFNVITKKYNINNEKNNELEYVSTELMPQEFSAVVKNLNLNEISKPFKTDFGWHIIKLIDKRKAIVPSYEELKYELRDKLTQEYIKSLVEELLEKNNVKITLE